MFWLCLSHRVDVLKQTFLVIVCNPYCFFALDYSSAAPLLHCIHLSFTPVYPCMTWRKRGIRRRYLCQNCPLQLLTIPEPKWLHTLLMPNRLNSNITPSVPKSCNIQTSRSRAHCLSPLLLQNRIQSTQKRVERKQKQLLKMINRLLQKKRKTPALVSLPFHAHVANPADNASCAVSEAAPELKVEESASEPVGAEKSDTTSGDVVTNVDIATEETPTAEEDTKAPPAEAETTPDESQSVPQAAEEAPSPESSGSNEDKQSKEADFPPIDPAAACDTPAAEGGSTESTVSRRSHIS